MEPVRSVGGGEGREGGCGVLPAEKSWEAAPRLQAACWPLTAHLEALGSRFSAASSLNVAPYRRFLLTPHPFRLMPRSSSADQTMPESSPAAAR